MGMPDGDNGWVLNIPSGVSQFNTPLSVRLTDTNGQVLTQYNLITTIANSAFNFSSSNGQLNYALPAGVSAEETSTPTASPFMKYGVPIIVAFGVLLLIIVIALVLRSKAKERGTSVSEYVRGSVAPRPQREEVALNEPTTPISPNEQVNEVNGNEVNEVNEQVPLSMDNEQVPLQTSPVSSVPDLPVEPTETSPVALPDGWEKQNDPTTGQDYYYNTLSGVTQWTEPEGAVV